MSSHPLAAPLIVEQVGDKTVVKFTCPMLWGHQVVQRVDRELLGLVEGQACRKIVLNLDAVQSMESNMLGRLISLHRKVESLGGRLAICQFNPELYATFELLRLATLLHIYRTQDEALHGLDA